MITYPEGVVLLCRNKKQGFGYKGQCLSPRFMVYYDELLVCEACGKSYVFSELKKQNEEMRHDRTSS